MGLASYHPLGNIVGLQKFQQHVPAVRDRSVHLRFCPSQSLILPGLVITVLWFPSPTVSKTSPHHMFSALLLSNQGSGVPPKGNPFCKIPFPLPALKQEFFSRSNKISFCFWTSWAVSQELPSLVLNSPRKPNPTFQCNSVMPSGGRSSAPLPPLSHTHTSSSGSLN